MSRDDVCDRFEAEDLPNLDVEPLRGRDLVCFCAPRRCHCDSILRKANREPTVPEIVEYEKLKGQLEKAWPGRKVLRFSAPADSPNPTKYYQGSWREFSRYVALREIKGIERLGKGLAVHFIMPDQFWHIHLSSTGWWMPGNEAAKAATTTDPIHKNFIHSVNDANIRVKMHLDDGQTWHYHDSRTWGKWTLRKGTRAREDAHLATYGPDWLLEPKEAAYTIRNHKSGRTVKDVLTDQHVTAGLGNYLACEIAFLAKVHPHRRWNTLTQRERCAIEEQATAFLTLCLERPDHKHWGVFDRKGEDCPVHPGTKIGYAKDGTNAKRGSYFCPMCQPEGT